MNVFAREEKKFLISEEIYKALISRLGKVLVDDEYYRYKICSIYYDTEDCELFRISADSPVYKEKLRVRCYGEPDEESRVFLEVKKKYDGIVYKRRISGKYSEIKEVIRSPEIHENDDVNTKEIKWLLNRYKLIPQIKINYEREAYTWKDNNDLRITFDRNICYKLENEADGYKNILDEGFVLMEIKCSHNLPQEFAAALGELRIYPTSFSKVGTAYKRAILPGYINKLKNQKISLPMINAGG